MKVIFLDIDGVMNTAAANGSHAPFVLFSRFAVEHLNTILEKTGAEIVISSNWRLFHSLETINKLLSRNGVSRPAIDITPIPDMKSTAGILISKIRGDEIQEWLDAHPKVDRFAIIDDDDDMGHLKYALVQTHPALGLAKNAAREVVEILNSDAEIDRRCGDVPVS